MIRFIKILFYILVYHLLYRKTNSLKNIGETQIWFVFVDVQLALETSLSKLVVLVFSKRYRRTEVSNQLSIQNKRYIAIQRITFIVICYIYNNNILKSIQNSFVSLFINDTSISISGKNSWRNSNHFKFKTGYYIWLLMQR